MKPYVTTIKLVLLAENESDAHQTAEFNCRICNPESSMINLRDYTRGPDGKYRQPAEFDLPKKPGCVSRIHLVRNALGKLVRHERLGTFRLAKKV